MAFMEALHPGNARSLNVSSRTVDEKGHMVIETGQNTGREARQRKFFPHTKQLSQI